MSDLIELRGGLTVPLEAYQLVCQLTIERDLALTVDGDRLRVSGPEGAKPELSKTEVAGIRRWQAHQIALMQYRAPTQE